MEAFGERLKRLRRARAARLNEETRPTDVAKAVGVTRAAYTNWETGIRKPKDVATYRRLAAFLGVGLGDLGVDIGEMRVGTKPDTRAKGKRVTKEKPEAKEG